MAFVFLCLTWLYRFRLAAFCTLNDNRHDKIPPVRDAPAVLFSAGRPMRESDLSAMDQIAQAQLEL